MPLIHFPLPVVQSAVAVVLRAADLVGRLAAERDHVKRIERDLRVRDGLRDRLLYPADMSIETALIEARCASVNWSKKPCKVAALRPGAASTTPPR